MAELDERRESASIDARGIRPPAAHAIADASPAPGVALAVLHGELDIAAAGALRARVDGAIGGRALVLDLADVQFIDSAILKELLRARMKLAPAGVRLVLAGVPRPVRRLMDLTRTLELFETAPDAAEALRRLSG
jgi:anti-sigma B factor antagonist